MRRKEYAASLGLAGTGRGRMSREALEAIEKARAEGMVFDDDPPVGGVKVSAKPKGETSKPKSEGVGEARFFYALDQQFTGSLESGKTITVSGRNVCRNTGYSMVGCGCGQVHETLAPNLEIISVTAK